MKSTFRFIISTTFVAAELVTGLVTGASRTGIEVSLPLRATHNASKPVDHAFASFSLPAHFFADYTGNKSHPNLFSRDIFDMLYEKTGAHPYVRVGGTSTDRLFYNSSQEESVILSSELENGIPLRVTVGPSWFEGFHNFPESLWNFQANLASQGTQALNNTILVCRKVMHELREKLIAFEIGNEPDLYSLTNVRPSNYTVSDYVAEWTRYATAISDYVLRGNKYGIPERTFFQGLVYATQNLGTFTTEGAFKAGLDKLDYVKSVSLHHYSAGSQPYVRLQNSFMNHTAVAANLSAFKPDMDVISRQNPNITFLLGETNSDYVNLNMEPIEGVFGSALWLIDYLLYGMTMNIARFNLIQGTTFGYTGWVPVSRNGLEPSVRPPLYGQVVVADIIGKAPEVRIQEVDLGIWNFSAYGIYESGKLSKYVLLNLNEWNSTTPYPRPAQRLNLGLPFRNVEATVRRLTGPGASATSGIKWSGLNWGYAGGRLVQSGKEVFETMKIKNRRLTLDVESSQCVVITLKEIGQCSS